MVAVDLEMGSFKQLGHVAASCLIDEDCISSQQENKPDYNIEGLLKIAVIVQCYPPEKAVPLKYLCKWSCDTIGCFCRLLSVGEAQAPSLVCLA